MSEIQTIIPEQACIETLDYAREIDEELGTRIHSILLASVDREPRLGIVQFFAHDNEMQREYGLPSVPGFSFNTDSGIMQIRFNTESEYLHLFAFEGVLRKRFLPHKRQVERSIGELTNASILDICIAHEFGHGYFVYKLADKYGKENLLEMHDNHSSHDKNSLPLALPSTKAIKYWDANRGGYRSCLETAGYDEARFQEMIDKNVIAYNRLPVEAVADVFALDIIKSVYPVS